MRWHSRFLQDTRDAGAAMWGRAHLITEEHLARWRRDEWPGPDWYAEATRERSDEEHWRARIGFDAARPQRSAAPGDFTARVMARVEVMPERTAVVALEQALSLRGAARALIGSVGLAALVALLSGGAMALLAPAQTLGFLALLLRVGALLLTLVRAAIGLQGGQVVSPTFLLIAALPMLALVAIGRATKVAREK